ncbi:MAG: LptF/LptG family permease [candidate division WOR-3 bacterium]|nr:LptF/LptG family permease [candidate division WOR-3 bacterium]
MKIIDRFLIKEFIKYTFLATLSVVAIYQIIDLFEELQYFINRRVSIFTVLEYYFYSTPSAVSLLLPVGTILACFFVYGVLTRERSIYVFKSAGINIYRLFLPMLVLGLILVIFQFLSFELITIPMNRKLERLKRIKIERRSETIVHKWHNLFVMGNERTVYFIQEYESNGTMSNFIIVQFDENGKVKTRYDGKRAVWQNKLWLANNIGERIFIADTFEQYTYYDTLILPIQEKPVNFIEETRTIEELNIWELFQFIQQLKKAGVETAKQEVEFHYRFAQSFISFILIILSLPLAVTLRKGGVMFGLGLGLLFSFIYWGLVQTTKAYGQAMVISPFLSAWLPNFLFLIIDSYLFIKVKK